MGALKQPGAKSCRGVLFEEVRKRASRHIADFSVARRQFQECDEEQIDCVCSIGSELAKRCEKQPALASERLVQAAAVQAGGLHKVVDGGSFIPRKEEGLGALRDDFTLIETPITSHRRIIGFVE